MLASLLPRSIRVSGLALPSDATVAVGSQNFLRAAAGLTATHAQQLILSRADDA
jgi:hypothetical protein